jgi:putative N6-adenine-specific DNA methylase
VARAALGPQIIEQVAARSDRQPMKARDCFAVATPGFEPVVAGELRAMGIANVTVESGGVAFSGADRQLFDANLRLRAASRVIVRIASFEAKSFAELERKAKVVRWKDFVRAGSRVAFRVTCHKSRLYHSNAVAERLATSVSNAVRGVSVGKAARDEDDADTPGQLFVVRFDRDACTISADASGELLHRRGYRLATAKAPMRETLAAGCLLALGYDGSASLIDPMCGSGTIAIEAALIARRIAPGINRSFACEQWPSFTGALADEARVVARSEVRRSAAAPILATDRDAGAIEATIANATRAGVSADLSIAKRAFSAIEVPESPGLLFTNPPYGARVGEAAALRSLYASIGNVAREKLRGWRVAMLSANPRLEGQTKLPFKPLVSFSNGGIRVRLMSTADQTDTATATTESDQADLR